MQKAPAPAPGCHLPPRHQGIHILCCAAPCSAARGPLDFLVIRVSTDLEVIQRSTFCAARYCAAEEQDSGTKPPTLMWWDPQKYFYGRMSVVGLWEENYIINNSIQSIKGRNEISNIDMVVNY
jgi:hypothetical protein